jgi:calcineurin-like phosphoesterase
MSVRITCIKKDGGNHENPYLAISTLSWIEDGTNSTGTSTRKQMYDFLVVTKGTAYVQDNMGNKANLKGALSEKGNEYVKTYSDNVTSDNLLKLPECKN